jgi:hypothetical protein
MILWIIHIINKMQLYNNYFENMRPQTLTTTKLSVNCQGVRQSGWRSTVPTDRISASKKKMAPACF